MNFWPGETEQDKKKRERASQIEDDFFLELEGVDSSVVAESRLPIGRRVGDGGRILVWGSALVCGSSSAGAGLVGGATQDVVFRLEHRPTGRAATSSRELLGASRLPSSHCPGGTSALANCLPVPATCPACVTVFHSGVLGILLLRRWLGGRRHARGVIAAKKTGGMRYRRVRRVAGSSGREGLASGEFFPGLFGGLLA